MLLYIKRFPGMIFATLIVGLLVRKLKSFLLTAVVALVILVVPLLLCLKETGILSYVMVNWFFL